VLPEILPVRHAPLGLLPLLWEQSLALIALQGLTLILLDLLHALTVIQAITNLPKALPHVTLAHKEILLLLLLQLLVLSALLDHTLLPLDPPLVQVAVLGHILLPQELLLVQTARQGLFLQHQELRLALSVVQATILLPELLVALSVV